MGQRASAGSVIEGKYRLERELGAGGMGSVWLATQLMVDRPVAVKLLHPAFVDQDDLQARFEVEAKAIGRLNHPNVITLYDFGFSEDLRAFYTVIEYIDGESLDKRLDRRIPLTEIVEIIRQIALALDHAHHHQILHRDLKPENVMLARMTDGTEMVKVLDFGIARIVKGTDQRNQESQRITKAGEVFGTPAYMSPEQARSVRQLEPAADLYSLGVMFYELVAGGLPFFAHSAFDLLMLHVTKPVPPIRRKDVPPDLAAIIYKLLEKEPEKRFQSGKEVANALEGIDIPEPGEEFESGPTIVSAPGSNPTLATPPPGMLGAEQTNPSSPPGPDFSLPTPSEDGPTAEEQRRPTMMLDGEDEMFSTGSFGSSNRSRAVGVVALALVAVVVAVVVAVGLSNTEPNEATAEPETAENQIEQPASDEEEEPAEIADAMENDPDSLELVDGERMPSELDPKKEAPKPKKVAKPVEEPSQETVGTEPTDTEETKPAAKTTTTERKQRRNRRPRNRRPAQPEAIDLRVTTDDDEKSSKKSKDALNQRITLD